MRRKPVPGRCRLCGKDDLLSFEHVPPQKAFNSATVVEYSIDGWLTHRRVKGKQCQGGMGRHTLCRECNSKTGHWYGGEYVRWARAGLDIVAVVSRDPARHCGQSPLRVTLKGVYPLRFLKQVVTCFFSVAGVASSADFAHNNRRLVRFVLDKHLTDLPSEYRFYLSLYDSSFLRRHALGARLPVVYGAGGSGSPSSASIWPMAPSVFSEITHPPFALVMSFATEFVGATEITDFMTYSYDDRVDLPLSLRLMRGTTPYPGEYYTA